MEVFFVNGMQGMGDTIYQRPFVKALAKKGKVYITTTWPELLSDIENVRFVKSDTRLRTQSKNAAKYKGKWYQAPVRSKKLNIRYGHAQMEKGSIPSAMRDCFKVDADVWDLPINKESTVEGKYAVIRPVTARSEWLNTSRNPDPEYIAQAADILHEEGYTIISIADLEEGKEWIVGKEPYADLKFYKGELDIEDIIALTNDADVVVAAVGFMTPMCMALGTPLINIAGGNGAHNSAEKVSDDSILKANYPISWIYPDNYCRCANPRHECDKSISNFSLKFKNTLNKIKGKK